MARGGEEVRGKYARREDEVREKWRGEERK
jgi:hypothetical protein